VNRIIKILLLQARNYDDVVKEEERRSFAEKAGLQIDQIVPHNLLTGPPSLQKIRSHDALMVGGSGDYNVSKQDLPQFSALMDILNEVVVIGHPTFTSCFGFHLLVKALGGEIINDPDNTEVGAYQLTLTESGHKDELFSCLPRRFMAQLGHKENVKRLPGNCINLASSEKSPHQAIRIPGKPIWASQFHPELSVEENLVRFNRYMDRYSAYKTEAEREEELKRFVPSPETLALIPSFLELVFG
jgi:GMP synthase (glutamine-hydrolysing)